MSTKEEVNNIKKKLEKIVSKENDDSQALDILKELKALPINFKVLSKTGIGQSVNAIRKASENEEVQQLARQMIKDWKRLVPKDDDKKDKEKEKEKEKEREKEREREKQKAAGPGADLLDEVRQKCCQMIADALKGDAGAELPDGIVEDPDSLAEKLEEAIFKDIKSTGSYYKNRIRSRVHNLRDKNNQSLRQNFLCGTITIAKLSKMKAEEMASDDMQKLREKHIKQNMDDAQLAIAQGTKTNLLQCGKCKKRECTYNQMQTRSSDEPMTTFVLCNHCGNRWKFC